MRHADPKLKQEIQEAFMRFIYDPAHKRVGRQLDRIMDSYSLSSPDHQKAFMYKGQVYSPAGYRPVRRVGLLCKRLYEEMEEYLVEERTLTREKGNVQTFFAVLLTEVNSVADLKVLTPEFLQPALTIPYHQPSMLKQEEIDQFHKVNQPILQTIKQRLVLNMIL